VKKILLGILQLAVTVAVLYWVFHDPTKRAQMVVALKLADYRWIAVAIGTYLVVEIAALVRWQILLKVQGIRLPLPRLAGLFLIGMFYNQFLPGGTGGDIMKSYLLLKEAPGKKAGALLSVLFDRLVGLVALVTITGVLVLLRYQWLAQKPETRGYLYFLLITLGISIASLASTFIISGFNLFHYLPAKFPGREKLMETAKAYHLYARHWTGSLLAFFASLIAHLATFATFLCVAYAFRARVNPIDFFAVMPIERTISAMPISFAGVGLREHVLQVMLNGLCDVPKAVAVLIGSMSFLVMLLCSMPGGLVYFFYKPSGAARHVPLREMQQDIAALEHEISRTE
jgi:uncharacterized protein (TIRG00374 family)